MDSTAAFRAGTDRFRPSSIMALGKLAWCRNLEIFLPEMAVVGHHPRTNFLRHFLIHAILGVKAERSVT